MSARRSHLTAAAIVLAAAVTALTPALAGAATPASAPMVNGTKGNGLTLSDGGPYVVMNGTVVDFHIDVRDLTWNPAGTKAAYIDSYGDLETANANGTDRDIVAIHPAGTVFSRPTWQVTHASDIVGENPALDNLIFVATAKGTSRLESITATEHFGRPTLTYLFPHPGMAPLPQTGNAWPSAGGPSANALFGYDNTNGEVYVVDDYMRTHGYAIGKGSEPAVSPNGDEIAFVRSVAGHDHLFVESLNSQAAAKDVTPSVTTDATEPTWSADGSTLAFHASGGTYTVPATGATAPVRVSSYTGVPAYRG